MPSDAASFFSVEPEQREKAVYVAGSEEALIIIANEAVSMNALSSQDFALCFPQETVQGHESQNKPQVFTLESFQEYLKIALMAVVPLALVLIISIAIIARDRILNSDIIILGLLFTTVGIFTLNLGLNGGITDISSQAGRSLRHIYRENVIREKIVLLSGVDEKSFITVPGEDGPETYIWIPDESGPILEKFIPSRFIGNAYIHAPIRKDMLSRLGPAGNYIVILLVVFFLGFLAIFAEPGLAVTAVTIEEMTIGTFKRKKLIMLAALGVGGGMVFGFARILFSNILPSGGIHLSWILVPCYSLALILTIFVPDDFSSIAWDTAGIATGPIAVPIMITMGLGMGNDSLRADGAFGIVATSSVFPIIAILVSGIIDKKKSERALRSNHEG
jgi:hypothetical protein